MKVLFVNDDPVLRRLADYALGTVGGMEVHMAPDGASAIRDADRLRPDVILMELLMPEMDGDEVFETLKLSERTRNVPVVFLTGIDNRVRTDAPLDAGVAGCPAKPFDPMSLADDLNRILDPVGARREEAQ